MTLREIIQREGLNPRVRRENNSDVGDDWKVFYQAGELDVEVERHCETNAVDWWKAGDVVLIDNLNKVYSELINIRH